MEESKCSTSLEIEELRNSIGVFPFEDSKYSLSSFSFEELNQITDGFSEYNLIGEFRFGKVYRGFRGKHVFTVKKWGQPEHDFYYKGENEIRQINEVIFLKQTEVRSHPNLVKLMGYCCNSEDQVVMVYDLNPIDSVHNLVPEDSFSWLQRIKVFLGFAHLLHFLHAANHFNSPYLVRNIDAAHILVDKDYSPVLYDFSMITGGIFPDWKEYPNECLSGCYGYKSISHNYHYSWKEADDVFAFGTVLLMLISKRVYSLDDVGRLSVPKVHAWSLNKYKSREYRAGFNKISLVHRSLLENHGYHSEDGLQITKLAISCVTDYRSRRPRMKQVMKRLLKLRVVQDHPNFLGLDQLHQVALSEK